MKKTKFIGAALLLLTALIWGSSFVAQSVGMEEVDAFTFNGIRTLMGAAALVPVILIKNGAERKKGRRLPEKQRREENRRLLRNGAILGVALCAAGNFQQFAFYDSTPGKIAFITAFYMFFVPLLGLFLHKKVPAVTWLCVIAGCIGLYFLCIGEEGFSDINRGDLLALVCSVLFAVHILLIERLGGESDPIKLSCVQFAVSGTITVILMFLFETPSLSALRSCLPSLLYSGVMSCGVAYTLQMVGQKYTESTVASILMCMESVFGVISSAVLLHQRMTPRELLGCGIMFAAIILSQFSDRIGKIREGSSPRP